MGERVTVELDPEALAAAREAGIDLSDLLTHALRRRLPHLHAASRQEAARRWYEENKEAVDAYNKIVELHLISSSQFRTFRQMPSGIRQAIDGFPPEAVPALIRGMHLAANYKLGFC